MQGGLLLIMDALKKGNTQEAERLLLMSAALWIERSEPPPWSRSAEGRKKVMKSMARKGTPRTTEADDALHSGVIAGRQLSDLSRILNRTESSIKSRLRASLKPPSNSVVKSTPNARIQVLRTAVSAGGAGLRAKSK